jgi:hypothetical protein
MSQFTLPRYLPQSSKSEKEKELQAQQKSLVYIPIRPGQSTIASASTASQILSKPSVAKQDIEDEDFSGNEPKDDLSIAITANKLDDVKKLIASGIKPEPYHFFYEGKRDKSLLPILIYLVDKADIDTLLEVGWSGDNHFKLWALRRILHDGTPQQKKELFDAAYEYAEVATHFGNNDLVQQLAPYIKNPAERRNLIELAIKQSKPATLIALLKGMKVDLYEYLSDQIPKEDEDATDEYPIKLAILKQLLTGSEYEQIIDRLVLGLDEYHLKISRKFNDWYTQNELAVNLHIDPNCGTCKSQLNAAYDNIVKATVDKKVTFLETKLKEAKEAKDKLGLSFLNDNDLVGNDFEEFYQGALVVVPKSANSKEVYWFSPVDYAIILEKKQNPYTNQKMSEDTLIMINAKIGYFAKNNVDYKKILPITDTIKILTDHKTYPYVPTRVERLVAAETVEEKLSKLVGGYYSPDVYEKIPGDQKTLGTLVQLIHNTLGININRPYDRKIILNALLNYILIDKETRDAAVLTVFNDYFSIFR